MSESMQYVLIPTQFSEKKDNLLWVEALPAKTWHTKAFGEVTVTPDTLNRMVSNFKTNVRGQEIATNYEHGMDRAKGEKASGWYRDFDIRDGSLWAGIELTPTAEREVKDGEWKYFSLEWEDFIHPETNELHQDVIVGGALTNVPVAKGLVPINFSELFEFAEKAPYGNVTYADPGYQADNKKRYPLDTETHIRAAWSYINQKDNAAKYTASQLAAMKGKIKAAMARIGAKVSMSEAAIEKELNDTIMPEDEATKIVDEHAAEEHQEPGTTDEPDPQTNPDDSDPDRHVTLPPDNDDDTTTTAEAEVELDKKLREALGLSENADIVKAVSELKDKVGPLEEVAKKFAEKKAFSEAYPEQAKELEKLRKKSIEEEAIRFSEKFAEVDLPDGKKFSEKSIDAIRDTHKAFAEGNVSLSDFEKVLDTITGETGIVKMSEKGSMRDKDHPVTSENPRLAFSEAVKELMESDKLEYEPALKIAAERYPELAEAYVNHRVS